MVVKHILFRKRGRLKRATKPNYPLGILKCHSLHQSIYLEIRSFGRNNSKENYDNFIETKKDIIKVLSKNFMIKEFNQKIRRYRGGLSKYYNLKRYLKKRLIKNES